MTKRLVIINEIAGLDASQGVYEVSKEESKKIKKNKIPNINSDETQDSDNSN